MRHSGIDVHPAGIDVPNGPEIVTAVVVDELQTGGVTPATTSDTVKDAAEYAILPTPAGVRTFIVPDAMLVTHCNSLFACASA